MFPLDPPERIKKQYVFWCFRGGGEGGVKKEHWEEKG